MSDAAALLARLHRHGITVCAEGETLRYRPVDALPPALVAELKRHKPALLARLAADDPAVTWRVAAMRRHLPASGPLPFLTARPVPRGQAGCQSCGEPLVPRTNGEAFRCVPCAHAAWLVVTEHTAR